MPRNKDSEETKRLKESLKSGKVEAEEVNFEEVKDGDVLPEVSLEIPDISDAELGISNEPADNGTAAQPKTTFNPLEGAPKSTERAYTTINDPNAVEEVQEIFTPPNISIPNSEDDDKNAKSEPFNPELSRLGESEKRRAAEAAYDIAVQAYKMLFDLAKHGVKIKDSAISKMARKDEINLLVPIPVTDENDKVQLLPFSDVVTIFNSNVEHSLTYSQDFIDKMREPVIRKFMEKDIGLTDNNQILYLSVMELARIGIMSFSLYRVKKDIIEDARIETQRLKKSGHIPPNNFSQQNAQQNQKDNTQTNQSNQSPIFDTNTGGDSNISSDITVTTAVEDNPVRETEELKGE